MSTSHYPFTAIIGQDEMCLALKLSAVDPLMGGVLVMGHRGTGKSTAIRALVNVLPKIKAVKNCMFNCFPSKEVVGCDRCKNAEKLVSEYRSVPVVNLPLGATEDRIIGSLDIQKALRSGDKQLAPGLLASANRGFLYVDDLADACIFAAQHYENEELINVGSGEDVTIRELVNLLVEVTNYKGQITWDNTKPNGTPKRPLDYSRLQSLGWQPKYSLKDGLLVSYKWYKDNISLIKEKLEAKSIFGGRRFDPD